MIALELVSKTSRAEITMSPASPEAFALLSALIVAVWALCGLGAWAGVQAEIL